MKNQSAKKTKATFIATGILLSLALTALLVSCRYAVWEGFYRKHNVNERASYLYELPSGGSITDRGATGGAPSPAEATGTYFVAAFSDIHIYTEKSTLGDRDPFKEGFKKQLTELKTLQTDFPAVSLYPKFALCLGDIADHGIEAEYAEYAEFTNELYSDYGLTTYNVLGNHDLYNTGWEPYEQYVYPYRSFYHFNTDTFSWYVIDSASDSMGPLQLRILEEACANDPSPKIFLMHCPLYGDWTLNMGYFTMQNSYETDRLITLAQNSNVHLVMEGHTHNYNEHQVGNFIEHTVSSLRAKHEWTLLMVDETNATTKRFRITEDIKTKEDFKRLLTEGGILTSD